MIEMWEDEGGTLFTERNPPQKQCDNREPRARHNYPNKKTGLIWYCQGKGTKTQEGCCAACEGTGKAHDESTNGKCWDCQGTGHTHLGECKDVE